MTITISRDLVLDTDGTVAGIDCGVRDSGVTVARQGSAPKIHLVPPARMAFAPALHAIVSGIGQPKAVKAASDGRITIDARLINAAGVLSRIDAACGADRGRGGIPDGDHGVYSVRQSIDGWRYVVETVPSGRASIKRIGTWTGVDGQFLVSYDDHGALVAILERAVTAKIKGETTAIVLPEVPGVTFRIKGGEILVCPDRRDNDILRGVPSLRWDRERRMYAVSTRYSKRLAKALEEIKARVEDRAVKEAEARAAAAIEATRKSDADAVERKAANERRAVEWERTRADREAAAAQARAANEEDYRLTDFDRDARGIGSYFGFAHRAPAVGSVIMVDGRARVVTALGRPFMADEDTSSLGGPVGAEGVRLRDVRYRGATQIEATPLLAGAMVRAAKSAAAAVVERMRDRVRREGEVVNLGREPEGDILLDNDGAAIYGYRTWLVLDAENGIWDMTYDVSDGATWGMFECGYCTRGRRLQLTTDETATVRAAIDAIRS